MEAWPGDTCRVTRPQVGERSEAIAHNSLALGHRENSEAGLQKRSGVALPSVTKGQAQSVPCDVGVGAEGRRGRGAWKPNLHSDGELPLAARYGMESGHSQAISQNIPGAGSREEMAREAGLLTSARTAGQLARVSLSPDGYGLPPTLDGAPSPASTWVSDS